MSTYSADVMDKIKKLLARATSSEAHEAGLALEMAQRLMREHGLTTEEVEVGRVGEAKVRSKASVSKAKDWELRLFNGIADAFGCGLMFTRGERFNEDGSLVTDSGVYAHYLFIAPAAEAQLAAYAAEVLARQLVNAKGKFLRTAFECKCAAEDPSFHYSGCKAKLSRTERSAEVDSYCGGWVASALSKVSRLVFSEARKRAIQKYVQEHTGGKKTKVTGRCGSAESRERGLADGSEAELNRPVEGRDAPKGIGRGAAGLLGSGKG